MIKGLILGILLGVVLVAGGVYFYFATGHAPVATSASPMPFETSLAKKGLHAYLDKLPHPEPQVAADETNLILGRKFTKNSAPRATDCRASRRPPSHKACTRRRRNCSTA